MDADSAGLVALKTEGCDAAPGYNYPRAGTREEAAREAPYDSAEDGDERIWAETVAAQPFDRIRVSEPGLDSRCWDGVETPVRPDGTRSDGRPPESALERSSGDMAPYEHGSVGH